MNQYVLLGLLSGLIVAAVPADAQDLGGANESIPAPRVRFTAESITPLQLFDQSCFVNRILLGSRQIEELSWTQIPAALGMMNSYANQGVFYRTTAKTQFVAITDGPSHTKANTVDQRCAIASQQITVDDAVKALQAAYGYPQPIDMPGENGVPVKMMIGPKDALLVIPAADRWVILRRDQIFVRLTPYQTGISAEKRKFSGN